MSGRGDRRGREGSRPLSGYRVLDLTRLLPGGFATALLADLGAEVIKVEEPVKGDYMRWQTPRIGERSAHSWITDRNKRSVALNLKHPDGVDAFKSLVDRADAVIESFRPGVMERLGIGYEDLRERRPQLVFCSLSGYGQDGPLARAAGHDVNYIGRAGLLSITGTRERPVIPGVQIADLAGGALMSLVGTLAALLRARDTGEGDHVDISMTDSAFSLLSIQLGDHFADGRVPSAESFTLNGAYPCYNVYECADGRWLTVGAIEEKFWLALCEEVGRPDLAGTGFDADAVPAWRELFRGRPRDEWLAMLGTETCTGPVNDFSEAVTDPQLSHREMVIELEDPLAGPHGQLATPIKLREHPPAVTEPPPGLGAHTHHYLAEVGIATERIEALIEAGAAGIHSADSQPPPASPQ
ncbi:MAG TPA: CaiB/BaiF CoA-transferase family protein [Solirubrobacterales bacterium]|nr:CaiB/BaiF CoA-transferase family protein [Solirubrobacterales bacterium]